MILKNSHETPLYLTRGEFMDIEKYPQFQLYRFTLHMLMLKNQLIQEIVMNGVLMQALLTEHIIVHIYTVSYGSKMLKTLKSNIHGISKIMKNALENTNKLEKL